MELKANLIADSRKKALRMNWGSGMRHVAIILMREPGADVNDTTNNLNLIAMFSSTWIQKS